MIQDPHDKIKGTPLWIMMAGFAAAALLTLAAAMGTSLLHRPSPDKTAGSFEAPVAQR